MNRDDLQAIARARLREAKALLNAGLPDGAYYLAGYAVECALKACIAKRTKRYDFPDKALAQASYTHNLRDLVTLAKLEAGLKARVDLEPQFRNNWDVVQRWSEQSRYVRYSADRAGALIEAVGNRKHGVMAWLRLHW